MFDFAKFSFNNKILVYILTLLSVVYGIISYNNMGKLQDPEFTIKDALVITEYPGASAVEVEQEVSNRLEETIQQLPYVKRIQTQNFSGQSIITVSMKDKYGADTLPQIWDELRKKVNQASAYFPPRVETPYVYDDFGDVYGILLAIYGDEYSYDELSDYIDYLKKELVLVEGVGKVSSYGEQIKSIYVELDNDKLSKLGITKSQITQELYLKNLVPDFGNVNIGDEYVRINSDSFDSITALENIIIKGNNSDSQIFLKDIATIKEGYMEPSSTYLNYDGHKAIGLGISTIKGGDVVRMGELVNEKLAELSIDQPLGIEIGVIAQQAEDVDTAIKSFMMNLLQAVLIVIAVLLLFMGLRSGLIIGTVLLVTITATFIFMNLYGILIERISLGALIIALGMLVDNAIVVVDGILVRINKGKDAEKAASEVVKQTGLPLLAATVIAILAFGAIGLSEDSTGEYTQSLFYVVMYSLGLSWVTAMTLTPLLAVKFLKPNKGEETEAYNSFLYRGYRSLLKTAINYKYITVFFAVIVFSGSMYNFQYVKQNFFPDSARPQILVDYLLPQGYSIETTKEKIESFEKEIKDINGIKHISSFMGSGTLRFLLTYSPEQNNASYAQMLIDVDDYKNSPEIIRKIEELAREQLPDVNVYGKKFILGPNFGGQVQIKIFGKDLDKIRMYESQIKSIIEDSPYSKGIRSDWKNRVKVIKPVISDEMANLNGISEDAIAEAILDTFEGRTVGVYRDGIDLLPIILRAEESERNNIETLNNIQIYSPIAEKMIPLKQIVSSYETTFEDDIIHKYNRKRALTIHADPVLGKLANDLLFDVKEKIEAIEFEKGYYIEWHGQYKDSMDAQKPIGKSLPFFMLMMVLIVIALFNSIKKMLVIWLTLPFALIGVVVGLLTMNLPFGFMSMLGFLSLSGMLIKNAIVLIDEIILENEKEGKPLNESILNSGVSRLRAVSMAALTTALGLIPLISDPFFASMAVVIIFGLVIATILTMILVPVYYAIFFGAEKIK